MPRQSRPWHLQAHFSAWLSIRHSPPSGSRCAWSSTCSGVKMPFPELQNNQSRTERVQLDTNGATVACLRLDDKVRWCYEHIAPVGARAEMLRITNEPVAGLLVGQLFHYVDDFDLEARSISAARPGSRASRTLRSEW